MGLFRDYLKSSIGKKHLMAITGIMLNVFLVVHIIGNMFLFVGDRAFNLYSHTLISNPLIYGAEVVLLLLFGTHIFMGFTLAIENHLARPDKYYLRVKSGRGATIASSTMPYTGALIFVFLVLHIIHFKYGPYYEITYGDIVMRDIHKLVIESYTDSLYMGLYLVAMFLIGVHLIHGIRSLFDSLGIYSEKYIAGIRLISRIYVIILCLLFSAVPILCYLKGGNIL